MRAPAHRKNPRAAGAAQSRVPTRAVDQQAARHLLITCGVLLATMLVYLRCLGNGFVFDDHEMIVINRYIGQWSFLWTSLFHDSWWFRDPLHLPQSAYYRPLQDIWLGLHYQAFGLNPLGWHATMVGLHLVAVWLVFRIATRLADSWPAAIVAALLFGLIPVHAEAVVWPAAIPIPLSATLELGAFYLFIARAGAERRNWTAALILYAAALFTHESAVAFPGLVAAYVFFLEAPPPRRLRERTRRALVGCVPFAVEVLAYLAVRSMVLGFINRPNPVNHATLAQALMTTPSVLVADLILLAIPWIAGPSHRVMLVTRATSVDLLLPLVMLLLLAGAFLFLIRNHPRRALYVFCALWMGIAVAPMMNLRGLFQQAFVQDRYLYLASVGWCVMLADWIVRVAERGETAKRIAWSAAAALAIVYAGSLFYAQQFWHDEVALFTRCIEEFPESAIWHNRLGMALEARGDLRGAERELSASRELDPSDGATLYDLGVVHARIGRSADAAREIDAGLALFPHAPPDAYTPLVMLYDSLGDKTRLDAVLNKMESLPGGDKAAGLARATLANAHRDYAGAASILRDLVARRPNDSGLWAALGRTLSAADRDDEALDAFAQAIKLNPRDAATRVLAARVLYKIGRDADALAQCRVALALEANNLAARALIAQIGGGPVK